MIESKESDYKTMALFFIVSLVIVLVYLTIYLSGTIQAIELMSMGLIHRTLILNSILLLGAIYCVLILYGKLQSKDFGLIGRKLPLAVIVGLITWILVQIIEALLSYIDTGIVEIDPIWNSEGLAQIGLLIGMVFGTALYEETGFRGFLLVQFRMKMEHVMENRYLQIIVALLVSQLFFSLLHLPWMVLNQGWTITVATDLVFSVFLNGIIYGLLYLRTENLFFVMIVHGLGNAQTSLVSPLIQPSNLLLLLAIIWAIIWPRLRNWENGRERESPLETI
ncbi:MAG: lysostaphin resistance A-like protein [Candidatus Thorarchaeota archaeon]